MWANWVTDWLGDFCQRDSSGYIRHEFQTLRANSIWLLVVGRLPCIVC